MEDRTNTTPSVSSRATVAGMNSTSEEDAQDPATARSDAFDSDKHSPQNNTSLDLQT